MDGRRRARVRAVAGGRVKHYVTAAADAAVFWMHRKPRGIDRVHDREAGVDQRLRLVRLGCKPDARGLDQGVEVAAEGEVVRNGPEARNVDRPVALVQEGRNVAQ